MRRKHVRLKSLCSNREAASQDCPVCIKRRIKCDRSLPGCQKCASRDITCPGYNSIHLKWGQGVASRGRLAGKSKPVLCQDVSDGENDAPQKPPKENTEPGCPSASQSRAVSLNGSGNSREASSSSASISHPADDALLVSRQSSHIISDKLLSHFCTEVIPRLTWIDLPEGPWRHRLLPLAERSSCLRLSINNIAAAHLFNTSSGASDQKWTFFQMHNWFRDASLQVLNHKMRKELHSESAIRPKAPNTSSVIEILAAMLTLCYTEAFIPGSRDWTLHLRACRTVMSLCDLGEWRDAPQNSIEHFLLKEVADLETLCSISVFREPGTLEELPVQSVYHGALWAFTGLLNAITTTERKRYRALCTHARIPDMDMKIWRLRAKQAHDKVSANLIKLSQGPAAVRDSLQATLRAHYHASLIYSYQAFASRTETQSLIESSIHTLLDDIQFVMRGPVHIFSHNLFFPIFIAGTECHGDIDKQSIIQKLFLDSLSMSGVWWNRSALEFLQSWWASGEHDTGMNWIQYNRENETRIGTFIVY